MEVDRVINVGHTQLERSKSMNDEVKQGRRAKNRPGSESGGPGPIQFQRFLHAGICCCYVLSTFSLKKVYFLLKVPKKYYKKQTKTTKVPKQCHQKKCKKRAKYSSNSMRTFKSAQQKVHLLIKVPKKALLPVQNLYVYVHL